MYKRIIFLSVLFFGAFLAAAGYMLGPGDVVGIVIPQDKNISFEKRELNLKGEIKLGYVGMIPIKGLSTEGAEKKIKTMLEKEFFKKADVSLQIVKYGSKKVKIYGDIRNPGEHALKYNSALVLDVIGLSGGKTRSASNIAYIIRDYKKLSPIKIIEERKMDRIRKRKLITLNYSFFEVRQTDGFEVKPGDFIFIPPVFKITVVGEVTREGTYDFTEKPDIVKAIASAQGFKKTANKKNLTIKRRTDSGVVNMKIDYDEFISEDNKTFNLSHNDVIVVHESWF